MSGILKIATGLGATLTVTGVKSASADATTLTSIGDGGEVRKWPLKKMWSWSFVGTEPIKIKGHKNAVRPIMTGGVGYAGCKKEKVR